MPASLRAAVEDGFLVVEGDATRDEILREAGVERAMRPDHDVDSDANNVYVTLSARAMNPKLFIVARANQDGSEAKLLQAGADRVVSPYTTAGRQIAELATRPRVADFIDSALSHGELAFSMEEVEVAADGPLAGRTIGSLVAEGIHPLAIVRGPGAYEPNPPADRVLQPGDGPHRVGNVGRPAAAPRTRLTEAPARDRDARPRPVGRISGLAAASAAAMAAPAIPASLRNVAHDHWRPDGQERQEAVGALADAATEDDQVRREQPVDRVEVLVEVLRPGLPGQAAPDAGDRGGPPLGVAAADLHVAELGVGDEPAVDEHAGARGRCRGSGRGPSRDARARAEAHLGEPGRIGVVEHGDRRPIACDMRSARRRSRPTPASMLAAVFVIPSITTDGTPMPTGAAAAPACGRALDQPARRP